jgi:hypothetical protein
MQPLQLPLGVLACAAQPARLHAQLRQRWRQQLLGMTKGRKMLAWISQIGITQLALQTGSCHRLDAAVVDAAGAVAAAAAEAAGAGAAAEAGAAAGAVAAATPATAAALAALAGWTSLTANLGLRTRAG